MTVDWRWSTRSAPAPLRRSCSDLHGLPGGGGVVAAVNTYEHWDDVLGNATLRATWPALTLHAHEEAAARTRTAVERVHGYFRADDADPYGPEVLATEALPAETTFSSVGVIDLGDQVLELMHPGRGHTGGDLVVRDRGRRRGRARRPRGGGGHAVFGPDSFPLEWSATLDTAIGLTT